MIAVHLAIQAVRQPEAIALSYGERRLSYSQLHDRSCRLAGALARDGVRHGDRVAVMFHNCPQFFEALFACAMLGAIFVPINFRLVAAEVGQILDACTPRKLLASLLFSELMAALNSRPSFPKQVHSVEDRMPESSAVVDQAYEEWLGAGLGAVGAGEPALLPSADAVLMLLHSSGTTGMPKGVIHTHATAMASSNAKIIDFRLTRADTTVIGGPLFHAGPLMDLALPLLLCGGHVVLGASRRFNPQELLATVAKARATVIPIYPTMLRRVLATPVDPALDLGGLRLIVTGGEAAPMPVIRGTIARFPRAAFINNYGSTEGGPITTFLCAEDSLRKIGSVGREAWSVQVRIEDADGRPLRDGEVGEVLVRSPFVCAGYWNQPAETAAQIRNGWWRTGDLGWRDEEGILWLAGRIKDAIKTGAEMVYAIETEQAIAVHPAVEEVGVIGVPDPEWGESIVAFVVLKPAATLDAAALIDHCQAHLASYKKPRHVRFIDSLPRGTTNKVDKKTLREWWRNEAGPPLEPD